MKEQTADAAGSARIPLLCDEIRTELGRILDFWKRFSPDPTHAGFTGKMDQQNHHTAGAPRGSVLNARILWAFSAAYDHDANPDDLAIASRAFRYIRDRFNDPLFGGLYWTVDAQGEPLDTHKQVYAQAFGIYGMAEYYRASGNAEALELARTWYQLLESRSLDAEYGGYTDAFARDWSTLEDKRLSAKDENAAKTMNTHLHLVEAYANLYAVWPDPNLRTSIQELLCIFQEKILDKKTSHLRLFFDNRWQQKPGPVSYGHDIEAGWLLQSCAEAIADADWTNRTRSNALRITDAAMEGLAPDGGLWYEFDPLSHRLQKEKHWWPQAEALIGFCNAWQSSGDTRYLNALLASWQFIKKYILDREHGEWRWGITERGDEMKNQDKIGLWKCPYHNIRACLQVLDRLGRQD